MGGAMGDVPQAGGRGLTRRGFVAASAGMTLAAGVAALAGGAGGLVAPRPAHAAGTSFRYGTTGYGPINDDAGLNPHENYSGWSCLRYGVGETLFRFTDGMEPEPWLADSYEFIDDNAAVRIRVRDGVTFSSGRALDGQAVKECLDDLVAAHDRAPGDLRIDHIDVDGQTVTIHTREPNPALVNYLCDPYSCIIDMQQGVSADRNVAGTGPYKAVSVSDDEIRLVRNESYWGGAPQVDDVTVTQITDGDTLTFSLQSGDVQACYGLPYASYALFADPARFAVSSCETSRVFFAQMNYDSPVTSDAAVRRAIAMGIDKEGFVSTLLNGRGKAATGPFPRTLALGVERVVAPDYDPEGAKQVLEEAGWVDGDGDGVREKDGQRLTIRWLTYPSRQELPLLAESVQASLRAIGMDVQVNSTASHTDVRKDPTAWDVYASALVTAPTGDPSYFFTATCTSTATKNFGHYASDELDDLTHQLDEEFDVEKRVDLAVRMQQTILDDDAFVFVSHLTMGIVSTTDVSGMTAHPCDYYEIAADLRVG